MVVFDVKAGLRAATLALPLVLIAGVSASAQMAPPQDREGEAMHPPAFGMPHNGRPEGLHEAGPLTGLARAEADLIAAQTLSALTNAPLPDVQRIVRTWDVPTALRYFDVAPKAFHDAVLPRLMAAVQDAAQQKRISPADAGRLIDQLQHEPPSPPGPPLSPHPPG